MRDVARLFKVLADEARVKMLWLLFHQKELCVCDFIEVLKITQSKASRHLRIMYHAGLLTDRHDGLWRYYALRPTEQGLVKAHLGALRTSLADRPDAAELLRRLSARLKKRCGGKPCCK